MGFLDKVKTQAEQAMKQGQEKVDSVQAKRRADGLLRDLGAWYYATETGRDKGAGSAELSRLVGKLKAHEAEHGPLGGETDEAGGTSDAARSEVKGPAPSNPAPPPGGHAPAFSPAPRPASPGSDPKPGADPSTEPDPSPDVDPVPPTIQPPPAPPAPEPPAVPPPGPDPDTPSEPSPVPSPPAPGTPSPPPPAPEVTPSPQPPAEVPPVSPPQPGGLPPMQAGDGPGCVAGS